MRFIPLFCCSLTHSQRGSTGYYVYFPTVLPTLNTFAPIPTALPTSLRDDNDWYPLVIRFLVDVAYKTYIMVVISHARTRSG